MDQYTNEQLLFELIRRNTIYEAPYEIKFAGKGWKKIAVPVGRNASVSIHFDIDDLKELIVLALVGKGE